MLKSRIKTISQRILVGKCSSMSFAANTTAELWREFMSRRTDVPYVAGKELYSVQHYAADFFTSFNPNTIFKKWAAVEVSDTAVIPEDMEQITIEGGMYAVFDYKGDARNAAEIFQYILGVWLPESEYVLDDRLHFEILGEKYKRNDPDSEEEIWIPIKKKK